MLSRVADSIYWMNRYLERAEHVARFVDVYQGISVGGDSQWAPLVLASGDEKLFLEHWGEFTQDNVLRFLLFDQRNPNSILSCLIKARENARAIRDLLTTALWEAVNRFYLRVRAAVPDSQQVCASPHDFLERVKRSSHQVIGVNEATFSHGMAWSFGDLGRMIERGDKTSRILDVKYFVLLPSVSHVGSSLDIVQWSALLDSTSALHMYRKRFGRIAPKLVAEFLVLDPHFPRSMRFCVARCDQALHQITGSPRGTYTNNAERLSGKLHSMFSYTRIDEIIGQGLHEFVDDFQTKLNEIDQAIFEGFFAGPGEQSQSQLQQ